MPALLLSVVLIAAFLVMTPAALSWLILLMLVILVCVFNSHCMAVAFVVSFFIFYLSNF